MLSICVSVFISRTLTNLSLLLILLPLLLLICSYNWCLPLIVATLGDRLYAGEGEGKVIW